MKVLREINETIQKEISLSGVGIHTGNTVNMTLKPAPVNHGFAFSRVDLEGSPTIEAKAEYVVNTQRGTNLEKNGVLVQTSEHVLAAAVGLDIDNLLIEIDASEIAAVGNIRTLLSQRIARLQHENGGRHLIIGWDISIAGGEDLHTLGDAEDLLQWLLIGKYLMCTARIIMENVTQKINIDLTYFTIYF